MPSFADDAPPSPPAATSDASPLRDAIRLTPIPELSLIVPRGWIACDPAINQQLGGNVLPAQFQQKFCDATQPSHAVFKLVDPNLTEFVMVLVLELPVEGKAMFSRVLSETGDVQQRDLQPLCSSALSQTPGSTCTANVGVVAGHKALVGEVGRSSPTSTTRVNGKFVVLATSNHAYALVFARLETAPPKTAAIIDALIASIETN